VIICDFNCVVSSARQRACSSSSVSSITLISSSPVSAMIFYCPGVDLEVSVIKSVSLCLLVFV
jgi:hypothetical protein